MSTYKKKEKKKMLENWLYGSSTNTLYIVLPKEKGGQLYIYVYIYKME